MIWPFVSRKTHEAALLKIAGLRAEHEAEILKMAQEQLAWNQKQQMRISDLIRKNDDLTREASGLDSVSRELKKERKQRAGLQKIYNLMLHEANEYRREILRLKTQDWKVKYPTPQTDP